jgi:hypothetical protein
MKIYTLFYTFLLFTFMPVSYSQIDTRTKVENDVKAEEKFASAQLEMLIGKTDKAILIYEELYKEDSRKICKSSHNC